MILENTIRPRHDTDSIVSHSIYFPTDLKSESRARVIATSTRNISYKSPSLCLEAVILFRASCDSLNLSVDVSTSHLSMSSNT